jgi:hypothetical protein
VIRSKPPIQGPRGVAIVPSGSTQVLGKSSNFFFVLVGRDFLAGASGGVTPERTSSLRKGPCRVQNRRVTEIGTDKKEASHILNLRETFEGDIMRTSSC